MDVLLKITVDSAIVNDVFEHTFFPLAPPFSLYLVNSMRIFEGKRPPNTTGKRPPKNVEWEKKLPDFVRRLEETLYRNAPSLVRSIYRHFHVLRT